MKSSHKEVVAFGRKEPHNSLRRIKRRIFGFARTTSLVIAMIWYLTIHCVNADDDAALLSEIRKAWQARQDHAKTLSARWTRSEQKRVNPNVPPDPLANEPRFETLQTSERSLRHEMDSRRWDVDGGPRGSTSWQTGFNAESYNPVDGWRKLAATDVERVRASGTVNRREIQFDGMWGRYVMLLWYRGLDSNLSTLEFDELKICNDKKFAHPDNDFVTLISGEQGKRINVLFLSRSLGYLPVGSRCGDWPSENVPFMNYEECSVVVSENSTALESRPVSWARHFKTDAGQLIQVDVCHVRDFRLGDEIENAAFKVEFPEEVNVYDASALVAVEYSLKTPVEVYVANQPSDKWSWHIGYYLAPVFAVVLVTAVVRRMWVGS